MKFGDYLRTRRTALEWTQPEAAAKIGIEQSYLSKLETGKAYPSEDVFAQLIEAYDVDLDAMLTTLFPGEVDRLRDIGLVRQVILDASQKSTAVVRGWLLAGLALLALGGAFLGLARVQTPEQGLHYIYQSIGVILPGESLDVFGDLDDNPDTDSEDFDERVARRNELIARIDEKTQRGATFRGPRYIVDVDGGKRVWQLVGGAEVHSASKYSWANVPGAAFVIGGLACFFISWRWR